MIYDSLTLCINLSTLLFIYLAEKKKIIRNNKPTNVLKAQQQNFNLMAFY